jgi:phospholipid/cholesterol/gamma-HCH transport system substrate-binding protein
METRANYVLIGLFTLAVIAGAFGFVYWFSNAGAAGDRVRYAVVFNGAVSGLRTGANVLFNGIRVGEVTELQLDPAMPRQVIAVMAVDRSVPVRADTGIGLDFQGLTGIASISLKGGSPGAPIPPGDPPRLVADLGVTQDVAQSAREVLRKIDSLVADNQESVRVSLRNIEKLTQVLADHQDSVRTSLRNIEKVSQVLADNTGRIDNILAGAERLMGRADKSGELAEAARAVRSAADNLDKRTEDISVGLSRFSSIGLREWEKLAVEGRRTLGQIGRTVKDIERNPSRLLFGSSSSDDTKDTTGSVRRRR